MKKNKTFIIFLLILGIGVLLGHSYYHTQGTKNTKTEKIVAPNTVEIDNYAFTPSKITVKKGTTVTWVNNDIAPHTVTLDNKEKKGPDSKYFRKREKYTYKFETAGTYAYHCEPHPYMKARVEVTE